MSAFTLGYQPVADALEPCVTLLGQQATAPEMEGARADRITSVRGAMRCDPPMARLIPSGRLTWPTVRQGAETVAAKLTEPNGDEELRKGRWGLVLP